MTIEDFKTLIETNKIKFTKPQQKIVDLILKGWKIWVVNEHRMNGGDWMWKSPHSSYPEYAGKVYKAFWNIEYQVKKQSGVVIKMGEFILRDKQ